MIAQLGLFPWGGKEIAADFPISLLSNIRTKPSRKGNRDTWIFSHALRSIDMHKRVNGADGNRECFGEPLIW